MGDMALDTTDMDSDTTARGLLMPSLRPRLIPTTLVDTMVDMVLVMPTTDMALDTMDMGSDTTARGLLMLRLIPTTMVDTMVDMAVDTMVDMDMVLATMAMDVVFMATMDKTIYPYFIPIRLQTHTFSESTAATMSAQKRRIHPFSWNPQCCQFQCCASLV